MTRIGSVNLGDSAFLRVSVFFVDQLYFTVTVRPTSNETKSFLSISSLTQLHHFHCVIRDGPPRHPSSASFCNSISAFFTLRRRKSTLGSYVGSGGIGGGIFTVTSALRLGFALSTAGTMLPDGAFLSSSCDFFDHKRVAGTIDSTRRLHSSVAFCRSLCSDSKLSAHG